MSTSLFQTLTLGKLTIRNRIAMAPLTRCRAGPGQVPQDPMTEYYKQRAGAGLIITEGVNVSPVSLAFEHSPGLWSQEQVEGWKKVTEAVSASDGYMFAQLWHAGRVGAKGLNNGKQPISPSAINDDLEQLNVWATLDNGYYVKIHATPSRALTTSEVKEVIAEYGTAAKNAKEAGFAGVQVHGTGGYLVHQFLSSTINQRTDEYGGSLENRTRFLREIVEALKEHFPEELIGVRLSPYSPYNNARESNQK